MEKPTSRAMSATGSMLKLRLIWLRTSAVMRETLDPSRVSPAASERGVPPAPPARATTRRQRRSDTRRAAREAPLIADPPAPPRPGIVLRAPSITPAAAWPLFLAFAAEREDALPMDADTLPSLFSPLDAIDLPRANPPATPVNAPIADMSTLFGFPPPTARVLA
eukprot:CAMPEP_0181362014 /NCGR_PEP_ID=MMETSP1106-20121128/7706_1 /TAXON_ID=81844 /ORGANISM="Mantoniella antarctica, Strain SL-175" /LENGTH=164 /DNA_ID=CAMNT_0023475791 /DNA_START=932 /DNA_END=1426 /DNA_ORIENTATION=+